MIDTLRAANNRLQRQPGSYLWSALAGCPLSLALTCLPLGNGILAGWLSRGPRAFLEAEGINWLSPFAWRGVSGQARFF